jgi:hypothetical protein
MGIARVVKGCHVILLKQGFRMRWMPWRVVGPADVALHVAGNIFLYPTSSTRLSNSELGFDASGEVASARVAFFTDRAPPPRAPAQNGAEAWRQPPVHNVSFTVATLPT